MVMGEGQILLPAAFQERGTEWNSWGVSCAGGRVGLCGPWGSLPPLGVLWFYDRRSNVSGSHLKSQATSSADTLCCLPWLLQEQHPFLRGISCSRG